MEMFLPNIHQVLAADPTWRVYPAPSLRGAAPPEPDPGDAAPGALVAWGMNPPFVAAQWKSQALFNSGIPCGTVFRGSFIPLGSRPVLSPSGSGGWESTPSLPCTLLNLPGERDESKGIFLGVQIGR